MPTRILVINPNSDERVTESIRRGLATLRLHRHAAVDCVTLTEGPKAIESDYDVEAVVEPLCRLASRNEQQADAFVIACFSDPGLYAVRCTVRKPVFGIAQSGILAAMAIADQVGILSILPESLPRHRRYFQALGIFPRIAGDLPIGAHVAELAGGNSILQRMVDVGRQLIDNHGADVLVLGCAGMAEYRLPLERLLRVPVVEPTQAAVAQALLTAEWREGVADGA